VIAHVTIELHLAPAERFDFTEPANAGFHPSRIRVRTVSILTSTDPGVSDAVVVSGTRYRVSGDPGIRPWTLPARLEQMPPHVLEGLAAAKAAFDARVVAP
jgi:hypothetical protein